MDNNWLRVKEAHESSMLLKNIRLGVGSFYTNPFHRGRCENMGSSPSVRAAAGGGRPGPCHLSASNYWSQLNSRTLEFIGANQIFIDIKGDLGLGFQDRAQ